MKRRSPSSTTDISPAQVRQAISANNFVAAVGQTRGSLVQVDLTTNTDLHSVADFKQLVVRQSAGLQGGQTGSLFREFAFTLAGAVLISEVGGMVTRPWEKRKRTIFQIMPEVQQKLGHIPGIRMFPVTPPVLPGGGQFPVEFVLASTEELDKIFQFAQPLQQKAAQSGMFAFSPVIDVKIDQLQSEIVIDRDKVADMGLTMQTVFTLFVIPSVYMLIAREHGRQRVNYIDSEGDRASRICLIGFPRRLNPIILTNRRVDSMVPEPASNLNDSLRALPMLPTPFQALPVIG